MRTQYTYKGFHYFNDVDVESDNKKIFHDVKTPEGKLVIFPWSPYAVPTETDFQLWVDLGCPKAGAGPLDKAQLLKLKG